MKPMMTAAGMLSFGLGTLIGPGAAFAQQACDLSRFTSAPFNVFFDESLTYTTHISNPSVTVDANYADHAQGVATVTYRGQSNGTYVFSGNAISGTGSITSSSNTSTTSSGSLTTNTTATGGLGLQIAGVTNGGIGFDIRTSDCTASVDISYFIAGTISSHGVDSGGNPIGSTGNQNIYSTFASCGVGDFSSITVTASQLNYSVSCQTNVNGSPGTYTASFSTSPLSGSGSIQITSVKISQGPPLAGDSSTKVPLVANRPVVLQIQATGTGPDPVPIKITLGTQTVNTSAPLAQLTQTPIPGASVLFTPDPSLSSCQNNGQSYNLSVSLNGGIPSTIPVKVFSNCHSIKYTYVAVNDKLNIVADPALMASLTNQYLIATEPLDGSYTSDSYFTLDESGNLAAQVQGLGFVTVMTNLSIIALKDNADRAIGIITPAYMQTLIGKDVAGVSLCLSKCLPAVLIEDKFPESAAHELGHTYGLYTGTELYDPTTLLCLNGDVSASNFVWLNKPSTTDYLQSGPLQNYMCASKGVTSDTFFDNEVPDSWATDIDFATVGAKYTKTSFDPETLIVSGYVDQTGKAVFNNYYNNPSGYATDGESSGQYQVQVLTSSGSVLSSTYLPSGPAVIQELLVPPPYAPFVVSLNYPSNAWSIQLLNGTTVIAAQNIKYGLLLTAMQNLQDGAFVMDPTERRTTLVNMVNAFNQQLATGKVAGAHQFLTNGIEPQISSWLSDSYVAPNPLFYTKASLLSLVDELAQRLSASK
jgi:hypothetical protein